MSTTPQPKGSRATFTDRVEALFRSQPNRWVNASELERVGGRMAWRTRISDVRKRGLAIENRLRYVRTHTADCPALQAWDISGACHCARPVSHVVSEYMFVSETSEQRSA